MICPIKVGGWVHRHQLAPQPIHSPIPQTAPTRIIPNIYFKYVLIPLNTKCLPAGLALNWFLFGIPVLKENGLQVPGVGRRHVHISGST